MFRFHEHGTKAGDGFDILLNSGRREIEKLNGQRGQGQMEVMARSFFKEQPGKVGGLTHARGAWRPHDNIQLRWKGGQKARFVSEFVVERQSSGARVAK